MTPPKNITNNNNNKEEIIQSYDPLPLGNCWSIVTDKLANSLISDAVLKGKLQEDFQGDKSCCEIREKEKPCTMIGGK